MQIFSRQKYIDKCHGSIKVYYTIYKYSQYNHISIYIDILHVDLIYLQIFVHIIITFETLSL
jgi:hypothetical protein